MGLTTYEVEPFAIMAGMVVTAVVVALDAELDDEVDVLAKVRLPSALNRPPKFVGTAELLELGRTAES